MRTLETKRLILRPFTIEDFDAVHGYAANPHNTTYMLWGPNTEADTQHFITFAMHNAEASPCRNYQYAAILESTGQLIGACDLALSETHQNTGEIGWILHQDYWGQGYATEMGHALIDFGFAQLDLHRIIAHCDAENVASAKLMERLGMRKEATYLDARPPNKTTTRPFSSEFMFAILKSDWEVAQEIAHYHSLPCEFGGFIDLPHLTNGNIQLICTKKTPADPVKLWVPCYQFSICKGSEEIGGINLRISYGGGAHNDNMYYGGNIGYGIQEAHRGKGYAVEACKLLIPVARAHKMATLLITNNEDNLASRRVCEKLGAKHIRLAHLPPYNDLYKEGQRHSNIFEWRIDHV